MRTRKAFLTAAAGALALVTGLTAPAQATTSTATATAVADEPSTAPTVYSHAAYLVDASSKTVLLDKNGRERLPIASLTKVMTAYVVLNQAKPTDTVQISRQDVRYARANDGTAADLRPGDRIPVDELMYGLLLPSGADAAHALARTYGPGVDGFVAKMNATAHALGMNDTEYVNADGLPQPGGDGYSTARDQAVLATKALQVPLIKKVVGTRWHTLDANGLHRSYRWHNTNKLLGTPGVIGLKTGFTRAAGYCLAFAGESHGRLLVGVLLDGSRSSQRFLTAGALLSWGERVTESV